MQPFLILDLRRQQWFHLPPKNWPLSSMIATEVTRPWCLTRLCFSLFLPCLFWKKKEKKTPIGWHQHAVKIIMKDVRPPRVGKTKAREQAELLTVVMVATARLTCPPVEKKERKKKKSKHGKQEWFCLAIFTPIVSVIASTWLLGRHQRTMTAKCYFQLRCIRFTSAITMEKKEIIQAVASGQRFITICETPRVL